MVKRGELDAAEFEENFNAR
jgi:hypothetical protein